MADASNIAKRRSCVCTWDVCDRVCAGDATINFPEDEESRRRWLDALGVSHHNNENRVSVAHFSPQDLSAKGVYPPLAEKLRIGPRNDAGPTLSEDDMLKASSGALERATRLEAVVSQHVQEREVEMVHRQKLEMRIAELETKLALSQEKLQRQLEDRQEEKRPRRLAMNYTMIEDMPPAQVTSLVGLRSAASLQVTINRSCFSCVRRR